MQTSVPVTAQGGRKRKNPDSNDMALADDRPTQRSVRTSKDGQSGRIAVVLDTQGDEESEQARAGA